MAYFPFFIDIEGKSILIVGGGNIALRKTEKILKFGAGIKVIAPEFCDGLRAIENVTLIQRKFNDNDIENTFAVISATNDRVLNERIYKLCTEKNILVNTVDDIDKCEFIFPSLICRNNVTLGISTNGSAPAFSKYLRKQIEPIIDKNIGVLNILAESRAWIHKMFHTDEERAEAASELIKCISGYDFADDSDIIDLLERIKTSYDNKNRNP
ncbi:MAG: bifunctional precorrin-2 dehydrogenase/sirohydrochlorin ferrochelatase [Ruminococcus sp.]|nr:bifunctional precorrin-2 dehydrogenase/sirohydrochlorin ferrochelatase [Ruminococcus sp.]